MRTLRFALPSLLGVAIFLVPHPTAEGVNIGLGILTDRARAALGDPLPTNVVRLVCVSAVVSAFVALARPSWSLRPDSIGAACASVTQLVHMSGGGRAPAQVEAAGQPARTCSSSSCCER